MVVGKSSGAQKSVADDSAHFADVSHSLGQVLHHGHLKYTSCCKMIGIRPTYSGQSFCQYHIFCGLLADNSTHLADGLHTADQVVLDSHINYLQNW